MKIILRFVVLYFLFFNSICFSSSIWKEVETVVGDSAAKIYIYAPKSKSDRLCVAKGLLVQFLPSRHEGFVTLVAINNSHIECKNIIPSSYFIYDKDSIKCSLKELPALYDSLISVLSNPSVVGARHEELRVSGLDENNISTIYCGGTRGIEYIVGLEDAALSEYGFSFRFKKTENNIFEFLGFSSAVE